MVAPREMGLHGNRGEADLRPLLAADREYIGVIDEPRPL
ncbi:hypothetical protein BIWAKO_03790 [Bosea sp. BIWAKO-01]|nr:hypothetical protein BIWAKO_03790 [Bosea sp. BIWAKO-01]